MHRTNSRVNRRAYLVSLVIAQVLCIAFGLSFCHNYISASVQQSLEQKARAQLGWPSQQAAQAISAISTVGPKADEVDTAARKAVLARIRESGNYELTLADPSWQSIVTTASRSTGTQPAVALTEINWIRSSGPPQSNGEPIRGTIQTSDGPHVAVAFPLSGGAGYVVAHRSVTADGVTPAEIRPILFAATGITMLWACGLSAITMYMATTYFHSAELRKARPDADALKQAQALVRTQETVIFGLAKLSDSRDPETGDHLDRIASYSTILASALRQHPDYSETITASYVHLIGLSSALHDIGKVGVEDAILRKPSSLTADERTRMKEHTRVGEECLKEIERRLGTSNFLQMAREIASSHHERWDGSGYPAGLAGERIPLAARIVAVADVYDALASKRVYKEALPHKTCVAMIATEAGKHFDPQIVEVFLAIESKFEQISRQFGTSARPCSTPDFTPQSSELISITSQR